MQVQLPVYPTPAASPLAHLHRTYFCELVSMWLGCVCSGCMLKDWNDMRCGLDYSEKEVRKVNRSLSLSLSWCAQRQDTSSNIWGQIRLQSFEPSWTLHAPQHVAVYRILDRWIKQRFHPPHLPKQSSQIPGLGIRRHTGFSLEFPSPRRITNQGYIGNNNRYSHGIYR